MNGIEELLEEISRGFANATKAAKATVAVTQEDKTSPMTGTKKISWEDGCRIVCEIKAVGTLVIGYDIQVTANDGKTKRTFEDLFVHVPLSEEERSSLLHLIYWAFTWIRAKEKKQAPAGADIA